MTKSKKKAVKALLEQAAKIGRSAEVEIMACDEPAAIEFRDEIRIAHENLRRLLGKLEAIEPKLLVPNHTPPVFE